MLALARPLAVKQRRRHGLRSIDRRRLVRDQGTHHARAARNRVGLNVGEPGKRLDQWIVDALLRIGARLSDTADREIDNTAIAHAHRRLPKTQPLDRPRPEILDKHVRRIDQPPQDLRAVGPLEVDRDRALAAVAGNEHRRKIADRRPRPARHIAPERLHLDDVGALIGQRHGRYGARDHTRQIDYPDP